MALADGRVPATAVDKGPFLDLILLAASHLADARRLPPHLGEMILLVPPFHSALYVGSRN